MTVATFTERDMRMPLMEARPDARAVNRKAIARLEQGDAEGALAGFREAGALDPEFAEAWNNSGMVLHQLGRFAEAVADFGKALAIRPTYAEALSNRGRAWRALGDAAAGLNDFDRALVCASGPFAASVLHNRGTLLQEAGDLAGALAHYDAVLRIDPSRAATYVCRAAARKEADHLADLDEALPRPPRPGPDAVGPGTGGCKTFRRPEDGAARNRKDFQPTEEIGPQPGCRALTRLTTLCHQSKH
jgi:tetratricopeptide (TPR) repeat protein